MLRNYNDIKELERKCSHMASFWYKKLCIALAEKRFPQGQFIRNNPKFHTFVFIPSNQYNINFTKIIFSYPPDANKIRWDNKDKSVIEIMWEGEIESKIAQFTELDALINFINSLVINKKN